MDIYKNRSQFKLGFVFIALSIAGASLYYTNILVNKLALREEKVIDLYAKALKAVIASQDDHDDQALNVLFTEVIGANNSIPVIMVRRSTETLPASGTGSSEPADSIQDSRNIFIPEDASKERKNRILQQELKIMLEQREPIEVDYGEDSAKNYVYYRNSNILYQLHYYPYAQLSVITIFGFLTYLAFSYSKKAEQNRVWVGLAKETAHQLGTPISSLMAWIDYLRLDPEMKDHSIIPELEKDVKRLEMITARFSSIGSEPTLKEEDVYFIVLGITNYLRKRISSKVKMTVKNDLPKDKAVQLNRHLFEWVIENICKNAVDAMSGIGEIHISLQELPEGDVNIEIQDTGKGMTKAQVKKVFNPGFTTKKRGWGLGLTLAKRIVENYHRGKLFIKQSEPDKGTTFGIILKVE